MRWNAAYLKAAEEAKSSMITTAVVYDDRSSRHPAIRVRPCPCRRRKTAFANGAIAPKSAVPSPRKDETARDSLLKAAEGYERMIAQAEQTNATRDRPTPPRR
jgi:hypothetical protein